MTGLFCGSVAFAIVGYPSVENFYCFIFLNDGHFAVAKHKRDFAPQVPLLEIIKHVLQNLALYVSSPKWKKGPRSQLSMQSRELAAKPLFEELRDLISPHNGPVISNRRPSGFAVANLSLSAGPALVRVVIFTPEELGPNIAIPTCLNYDATHHYSSPL